MKLTKEILNNFIKPKPWEKDVVIIILFITLLIMAGTQIYNHHITTQAIKEMNSEKQDYIEFLGIADNYVGQGNEFSYLSVIQFELNNFTEADRLSKEARKKYSEAQNYFFKAIAVLKLLGEDYLEYINLTYIKIDMTLARYEACENFEYAALNYQHRNFDRANLHIEEVNKKIVFHDKLVREYRLALAEIQQKLYISPSF